MESVESSLVDPPVGFRFRPTDEELVNHYLKLKTLGNKAVERIIPEVDVHQLPPWDLSGKINELSKAKSDGDEWFFFCHLQNKYPQSKRSRRTNDYGSWKPTGKTHKIRTQDKKKILGLKKILVFKKRQSPKNAHTKWVLHEYQLNSDLMVDVLNDQSDVVLYRLKKKPDKKGKENSKTQKTNTGISINTLDEVNSTSISNMPHKGNRSCCNTPDEFNNTSCSSALVTTKSLVSEEIPKESVKENVQQPPTPILSLDCNSSQCDVSANPQPPTASGEQFSHDLGESMKSLPPLQQLDDTLLDYNNAPAYQRQGGAEEGSPSFFDFSYDNNGNELSHGYMPAPYGNLANYFGFSWGNV